jgi:hypothetical protein
MTSATSHSLQSVTIVKADAELSIGKEAYGADNTAIVQLPSSLSRITLRVKKAEDLVISCAGVAPDSEVNPLDTIFVIAVAKDEIVAKGEIFEFYTELPFPYVSGNGAKAKLTVHRTSQSRTQETCRVSLF